MAYKINLEDLKKKGLTKDPFPAPEGYFDDLSSRIQQRMGEEVDSEEKLKKVIGLSSGWYYVAAAVAALILATWLVNPFQTDTSPVTDANSDEVQTLLADVSNQDLIDYLQMSSADVVTTVSLTEEEQEELLNEELESYDLPEDYYLETDYLLEEYL